MLIVKLEQLPQVLQELRTKLSSWGVAGEASLDLELACEEVILNVFHHCQAPPGTLQLKLEVSREERGLCLVFRDNGQAYNPLRPAPEPGGRSIPIVKALVDELHYQRQQEENVLTLWASRTGSNEDPPSTRPASSLTISVRPELEGARILTLSGRLDSSSADLLEAAMQAPENHCCSALILDLSSLTYLSSAGLRQIFKARKHLLARGGVLRLLSPLPQVRKIFQITKVVPAPEILTSLEEIENDLQSLPLPLSPRPA